VNNKEEKQLADSINKLAKLVERLRDEKYLQMIDNKKKFLWYNFLSGAARGLGFIVGSTILLAFIIWLLTQLLPLPIIGKWIADLINYIQEVRLK